MYKFKNKFNFNLACFLLMIMAAAPISAYAATVSIQSWDLVDSGKHCDYDGDSAYMSYVDSGASTWNGYKSGVIREDSASVIEDVYCSDTTANNNINATTYSSGKIVFNTTNMDAKSSTRKLNIATHELGHCLGLDHNTSSDVMYAYDSTITSLSANDKASYDAAYNNY